MSARWNELPTEVLQTIFNLIYEFDRNSPKYTDLQNSALVCQNWNRVATQLLYKEVLIRTVQEHLIFHETMKNTNKCNLVKRIHFYYQATEAIEEHELLTTMFDYLPCLQVSGSFDGYSYLPLLDAIMDGKLPELEIIENSFAPDGRNNHLTCLMLIKDRLKKIASHDAPEDEMINMIGRDLHNRTQSRIHQILNQPNNVISEYLGFIGLVCDEIGYVESITKKCKHLNNLYVKGFVRDAKDGENSGQWTRAMIDQTSPKFDMKALHIDFKGIVSSDFISYMMHKFPKLEDVHLSFDDHYTLEHALEMKLVGFLANIQKLYIHYAKIPSGDAWELIRHYIKSFDTPQSLGIDINLCSPYTNLKTLSVHRRQGNQTHFGIYQPSFTPESERMEFFTKYGHLVTSTAITGHQLYNDILDYNDTSSNFHDVDGQSFYDILKHCPKINAIHFNQCIFRPVNWESESNAELSPKKLKNLSLTSGLIHQDYLLQLSNLFNHIETLSLQNSTFCDDDGDTAEFEMDMRHTTLKRVDLGNISLGDDIENKLYVHVYTASRGESYYALNRYTVNLEFRRSNEVEYHDRLPEMLNNSKYFSMYCQDVQEVRVSIDWKEIILKLK